MPRRRDHWSDLFGLVHRLEGMSTLWNNILRYLRQIPELETARLFLPASLQAQQLSHSFADSGIPAGEVSLLSPLFLRQQSRTCSYPDCRTQQLHNNLQR
uniref:ORFC2 n=1 Tax=Goose circovirus TaxID=146032 RepID=A0A8E4L8N9_GOCV|nr:ORFC2 [Goose circovirus]QNS29800.1 ORFC2 [Goose circovirus]QNS29813.1 ORFC2 [Goose circovirus]USE40023.1 ORFC2 [Goose circovirus]USE40051.1 ORFC2 [Goose circovirus]